MMTILSEVLEAWEQLHERELAVQQMVGELAVRRRALQERVTGLPEAERRRFLRLVDAAQVPLSTSAAPATSAMAVPGGKQSEVSGTSGSPPPAFATSPSGLEDATLGPHAAANSEHAAYDESDLLQEVESLRAASSPAAEPQSVPADNTLDNAHPSPGEPAAAGQTSLDAASDTCPVAAESEPRVDVAQWAESTLPPEGMAKDELFQRFRREHPDVVCRQLQEALTSDARFELHESGRVFLAEA